MTLDIWTGLGVEVHILDKSLLANEADQKVIRNVTLALIAAQRHWHAMRAKRGWPERRKKGRVNNQYAGGLGYKVIGPRGRKRVAADPEEREVIALIHECRQKGLSTNQIYWRLCLNKVRTKHGREWTIDRINRAIQMEKARL